MYPHSYPSQSDRETPLDKLSRLTALQNQQQASDQSQLGSSVDMLSRLYGIQHEQQMAPEQLRALQESTNARQFETQRGNALLPGQIRSQNTENAGREFEMDRGRQLLPGQLQAQGTENEGRVLDNSRKTMENDQYPALSAEHLHALQLENEGRAHENAWRQPNSEAEYGLKNAQVEHLTHPGKYDQPDLHSLLTMQQMGLIKPEDIMSSMPTEGPYAGLRQSYMSRLSAEQGAKQKEREAEEARMRGGAPGVSSSAGSTANIAGQHLGEGLHRAVGNPIMDLPANAYNSIEGGYDYLSGLLGAPGANSRMHTYDQMMTHPYGSMFFDPSKPEEATPLPRAREQRDPRSLFSLQQPKQ